MLNPDFAIAKSGFKRKLWRRRRACESKGVSCGAAKGHTQTNASRAFFSALEELYGLGFDNYTRYQEHLDKVDKEDVMRAARVYLRPENMVEVVASADAH